MWEQSHTFQIQNNKISYSSELVVEIRRVNDRPMTIKLVVGGLTLNVSSAYAPQWGLEE